MKSIKPGRGPSMMGAVGSVFAVFFGIIWTFAASSMGAPFFFPLFGLMFIGIGIFNVFYNYKNATSKNRFSIYDITDSSEESDPLAEYLGHTKQQKEQDDRYDMSDRYSSTDSDNNFCPYCGNKIDSDFEFCNNCGKRLPD